MVRLAAPGRIRQAGLDTSNFKGNSPGDASLRGADARSRDLADPGAWFDLPPRTRLQPDTRHRFPVAAAPHPATHVRLDIFPDGGMARLRLYGKVSRNQLAALARRLADTTAPPGHRAALPPHLSRGC